MKIFKKMLASAAAGTMALTAAVIPALAAPADTKTLDISEIVTATTVGNVTPPAPTFNFTKPTITPESNSASIIPGMSSGAMPGVDGGLTVTDLTKEANAPYTYSGTLTASAAPFNAANSKAGAYVYKIDEPTTTFNGISQDGNETYYAVVYVVHAPNGGTGLMIDDIIIADSTGKKVGGGTSDLPLDFTSTYTTKSVTVSKKVAGNLADKNTDFTFTPTIATASTNNVDGNTAAYCMIKNGTTTNPIPSSFTLRDGESVTFYGLTAADTFTVEETDGTSQGYIPSYILDTASPVTASGMTAPVTIASENHTVAFTNTRESAITPTGFLNSSLPFIVGGGLAVLFALVFFRRKREE